MRVPALFLACLPVAQAPDVFALWEAFEEICAEPLWPGFDPCATPVLVYDGESTYLFGHPDPPSDFASVEHREGVFVRPGHHPQVRANSSTELGGVSTATCLFSTEEGTTRELAAIVVHEVFHVFEGAKHPGWGADESQLLLYPATDGEHLFLRRLETEALRRALAAEEPEALGWAVLACDLRSERFALVGEGIATYERAAEMHEGLAQFVQHRSLGRADGALEPEGYAPEGVRTRIYDSGEAWALLLDRFVPGWQEDIDANRAKSLDALLTAELEGLEAATFSEAKRAVIRARALADAADVERQRAQKKRMFEAAAGWRIEILAEAEPLQGQGFDPLNVSLVAPNAVLHERWVKLGNGHGTIELLDRASLAESAGEHPLFSGVRRLLVTGLPMEPLLRESEGTLRIEGAGVDLRLERARVERSPETIRIVLEP